MSPPYGGDDWHEDGKPPDCFLRATAVPAGTAVARISYGNSVCLSVTTQYGFKARWDRDTGSSTYDSLESLVSNEVISVPLGEEIPLE